MTIRSIIITVCLIVTFSRCGNDSSKATNSASMDEKAVTGIEIYLLPAFNCYSKIVIDKASNKAQFKLDETEKRCHTGNANPFVVSLDSFKRNTLMESFYSPTFLDSIKFDPDDFPAFDGLTIMTVVKRGNFSDTINSANIYPKILTENIISQIDYISKRTTDTVLKKYIEDLRKYFH